MNKSFFFLLTILLIGMMSMLSACKEVPGCTDLDALNYSPDANSDNGTCEFARDVFIGSYIGTSVCTQPGFWDSNDFQFDIREEPDDPTLVRVALPFRMSSKPVTFTATVDGNTLIFDQPTNEPDNLPICGVEFPDLYVLGNATLTGTQFSFPAFKFHVQDSAAQQICPVECQIVAEKQ